MLNLKKRYLPLSVLLASISLSGCNDGTTSSEETLLTSNNSAAAFDDASVNDSIDKIGVERIGSGKDLSEANKAASRGEARVIATVATDSTSNNDSFEMKAGEFHRVAVDVTTDKDHPNGLKVELTLVSNVDTETGVSEIPLAGISKVMTAGSNSVVFDDVLIPKEIPAGEYRLIARAEKNNLEEVVNSHAAMSDIPEFGGINVKILAADNITHVDLVDAKNGEASIDLVAPADFKDGYTLEPTGDAELQLYSTSSQKQNINLSAKLKFPSGASFDLGLLDTSLGTISDTLPYELPGESQVEPEGQGVSAVYYIKEADFDNILKEIKQDLAQGGVDGTAGTIEWHLSDADGQDIADENIDSDITLTKFIENLDYDTAAREAATVQNGASGRSDNVSTSEYNNGLLFKDEATLLPIIYGFPGKFTAEYAMTQKLYGYWDLPRVEDSIGHELFLTFFGSKASVINVSANAYSSLKQINPAASKSGITRKSGASMSVSVFGSKWYESSSSLTSTNINSQYSATSSIAEKEQMLTDASSSKLSVELPSKGWHERKTLAQTKFVIGPVPIGIEAGVTGDIKPRLAAVVEGNKARTEASIPITLGGFLFGGVDTGVAKAGVLGDLSVVDLSAPVVSEGKLSVNSNTNKFSITATNSLDMQLRLLRGTVSLAANVAKIKWCKKWGIPYPCGVGYEGTPDFTLPLYTSPWAFNRSWPLFNTSTPKSFDVP